jgi:hypothetical protein
MIWTRARTAPLGELGVRHYGIVVDAVRGLILHNPSEGVRLTTWSEFANGLVYIERRASPRYADVVVRRAHSLLGKKYDLLAFNCEHFANFAAVGVKASPQVQRAGLIAGGIALAVWLLGGDTHYDRDVDRYRDKRTGRFATR